MEPKEKGKKDFITVQRLRNSTLTPIKISDLPLHRPTEQIRLNCDHRPLVVCSTDGNIQMMSLI